MKNYGVLGLVMLLGMDGVGSAMGQEPDPAEVQRSVDRYIREAEEEAAAAKKAAPKPRPKPAIANNRAIYQDIRWGYGADHY